MQELVQPHSLSFPNLQYENIELDSPDYSMKMAGFKTKIPTRLGHTSSLPPKVPNMLKSYSHLDTAKFWSTYMTFSPYPSPAIRTCLTKILDPEKGHLQNPPTHIFKTK